ncbi:MAG: hypothetical protein R3B45_06745 [Bdellovibrionota bacterium]
MSLRSYVLLVETTKMDGESTTIEEGDDGSSFTIESDDIDTSESDDTDLGSIQLETKNCYCFNFRLNFMRRRL